MPHARRPAAKIAAITVILILLAVPAIIAVGLGFGSALGQREPVSTIAIVVAVIRLRQSGGDIIAIRPNVWLKRAYINGVYQETGDILDRMMAKQGWVHTDQEGEGRVYTRGADRMEIDCDMYSIHYQVCVKESP